MRSLFIVCFLLCATSALAQSGAGSQDSVVIGDLRARSTGAYIVGCYPCPAHAGQPITVQTYNRDSVVLSVTLYDAAGREMFDLLPKKMTPGGLQTLTVPPTQLSAGVYHVQLLTWTSSDPHAAVEIEDVARFVIIH